MYYVWLRAVATCTGPRGPGASRRRRRRDELRPQITRYVIATTDWAILRAGSNSFR